MDYDCDEDGLIGREFGRFEVIQRGKDHIQPSGKKCRTWLCICGCGNQAPIPVLEGNLVLGTRKVVAIQSQPIYARTHAKIR
jgi:hypothetical protein